jgi:hypothetical protein
MDLDSDQDRSGSFLLDQDLWKSYDSSWWEFQPSSPIGIRVVAKSAGSKYLILHLWMPYFIGRSLEKGDFYMEKRLRKP